MRAKINDSLSAKVFLWIAGSLILCSQGESLKPLKKWKEKKRMLQFISGLVIGGIFGVVLMCLLQINKTG